MYDPIFDATFYTPGAYAETVQHQDFASEDEAYAACEKAGAGSVVKFACYANAPGCLPAIRQTSIWLKVYENGAWKSPNIHG